MSSRKLVNLADSTKEIFKAARPSGTGEPDYIVKYAGGLSSEISPIQIVVYIPKGNFDEDAFVIVNEIDQNDPSTGYLLGYAQDKIFRKPGVRVKTDQNGARGIVTVDWSGIYSDVDVSAEDPNNIATYTVQQAGFVITKTL